MKSHVGCGFREEDGAQGGKKERSFSMMLEIGRSQQGRL